MILRLWILCLMFQEGVFKIGKVGGFVEESKTTLENRKASSDFVQFLLGILSFKSAL